MKNREPTARQIEQGREQLSRARNGDAASNYPAIFAGFEALGIPADDIMPRVNVFTYRAWQAQNRQVRRGEHGVKVVTWITGKPADDGTEGRKFPKSATVFHVTQTDPKSAA